MQGVSLGTPEGKYQSRLNPEFGDVRGFWKLYDNLADRRDRDLSKDLNASLDTLLIFAGLVSAINTTFITSTISDLKPDSSDKTNALLEFIALQLGNNTLALTPARLSPPFTPDPTSVAANCLLYASLCCSLFSAAGAMLGKEWLRHLDRKEQIASLSDQARFRQKKFRGIQRWHFQDTIQIFPYLLLISVFLFFAGLVPYLLQINKAVAGVVIAFLACAIASWGLTILSCVVDPLSPYQTSLTFFLYSALQRNDTPTTKVDTPDQFGVMPAHVALQPTGNLPVDSLSASPFGATQQSIGRLDPSQRSGYAGWWDALQQHPVPVDGAEQEPGTASRNDRGSGRHLTLDRARVGNRDEHILNAETVSWLLGVASEPEDLVVIAQNLCWLEMQARRFILRDNLSWQRLLVCTLEALKRWRDRPNENDRLTAEYLGAAICRLLMEEPQDSVRWKEVQNCFDETIFQSRDRRTLSILKSTLIGITDVWNAEVREAEDDLRKCFLERHIARRTGLGSALLVGFVQVQYDDIILNLLAAFIAATHEKGTDNTTNESVRQLSIKAYHGENLIENITNALARQDEAFNQATQNASQNPLPFHESAASRDSLAEIYAAFFQRVKEPEQIPMKEAERERLREQLCMFLRKLEERVPLKECTPSWIESSMEAVFTLRKFSLEPKTCKLLCTALAYIVAGADKNLSKLALQQFTRTTLEEITGSFQFGELESLGDNAVLIKHFASVVKGPDNAAWLKLFAKFPAVWRPTTDPAKQVWKESGFASEILNAFKKAHTEEDQDHLASIMVHIASTRSTEWCDQLIEGALTEIAEQIITGKGNQEEISATIPLATVLLPFIAVVAVHPIDRATDQMDHIVGALSAAINSNKTDLLKQIASKYSQSDISDLIKLVEEVSDRRKYEGDQKTQVTKAVDTLRTIKPLKLEISIDTNSRQVDGAVPVTRISGPTMRA